MSKQHQFCCSDVQTETVMSKANIITSTCIFSYYQNISVHATLIPTNDFFFLLNIKEELRVTCVKYNRETTRMTYTVSIINCKDL